jgi:chemotaxis protein methyltransferase CheR
MAKTFYNELLQHFQDLYNSDLSGFDMDFISKQIDKRIGETAAKHQGDYVSYLKNNQAEAETLYQSLFIGFSTFFRNPLSFAMLEKSIFPKLIREHQIAKRSEIRIWSAGCSTGQEPYSVAILLEHMKQQYASPVHYRIFATDLSPKLLDIARQGNYRRENLNNIPLKFIDQWFISSNGQEFQIGKALAENIDFSCFDLLNKQMECPAASIFGNFDLVMCSNLLIYYQPAFRERIIGKLLHCLKPGGYLITGETERELFYNSGCSEIVTGAAIFQKTNNNINHITNHEGN